MTRPVALLTGANSGIGFECARALTRDGWHVLMASRNREVSAEAVRRLEQEAGAGCASELGLDLASFASIRSFVKEVEAGDWPVRVLICNAGLQAGGEIRRSPGGHELTFAVNHLGHFLLTHLLLRRLLASAPARILVVSSGVHDPNLPTGMPKPAVSSIEDLATSGGMSGRPFDGRLAYVHSKLCNLWFAYELARRIESAGLSTPEKPLSVNAYEPGLVPGSGLARDYPPALRFIWNRVLPAVARVATRLTPTINTAETSGRALAKLAVDPELEQVSGRYFPSHTRWQEGPSSDASRDEALAGELWTSSVRLCELSADDSPLVQP